MFNTRAEPPLSPAHRTDFHAAPLRISASSRASTIDLQVLPPLFLRTNERDREREERIETRAGTHAYTRVDALARVDVLECWLYRNAQRACWGWPVIACGSGSLRSKRAEHRDGIEQADVIWLDRIYLLLLLPRYPSPRGASWESMFSISRNR